MPKTENLGMFADELPTSKKEELFESANMTTGLDLENLTGEQERRLGALKNRGFDLPMGYGGLTGEQFEKAMEVAEGLPARAYDPNPHDPHKLRDRGLAANERQDAGWTPPKKFSEGYASHTTQQDVVGGAGGGMGGISEGPSLGMSNLGIAGMLGQMGFSMLGIALGGGLPISALSILGIPMVKSILQGLGVIGGGSSEVGIEGVPGTIDEGNVSAAMMAAINSGESPTDAMNSLSMEMAMNNDDEGNIFGADPSTGSTTNTGMTTSESNIANDSSTVGELGGIFGGGLSEGGSGGSSSTSGGGSDGGPDAPI